MRGPDAILIGAMKCGTTTLAEQLGRQDGLFLTDPKEPNYFSDDDIFAKGPAWYADLFAGAAEGDLTLEASTHYTKLPDRPKTVARMKAALPEVRLVYMIRDPMVRLVSHWVHGWSLNEIRVPLEAALERHPELVDYGRYAMQVRPFLDTWGPEAVLLTSLERMQADPEGELARVAAHIGYAGKVHWREEAAVENASATRFRRLPMAKVLLGNPVARTLRRALIPKSWREKVRAARTLDTRPDIPADRVADLRARFAADREDLARLFPGDPSVDLAYPWRAR